MKTSLSALAAALALIAFGCHAALGGDECKSADGCRLIYSNCGCEAVPKADPRRELRSDAVCKWNLCRGTRVKAVCRAGRCCRSDAGSGNAPPCGGPDLKALRKACRGDSCCLESVGRLEQARGLMAGDGKACPDGFKPNMLRCESSYRWCEPSGAKKDP